MYASMQPLPESHAVFGPHIDRLRVAGDRVGEATWDELEAELASIRAFLHRRLIPRGVAEELVLYPAVQWALNSSSVTLTMVRDHAEIGRLTADLERLLARGERGAIGPDEWKELRRILYGLHAIITVHFAKEEEIYHPLLQRYFSEVEIAEIEEDMENAESERAAGPALA